MARILVIDDDVTTLAPLEDRLRRLGHDVTSSRGGAEGIGLAAALVPELVILELALPDVSGTEVCRALRAGLVERRPDPADRRAYRIFPTAAAEAHLNAIEELVTAIRAEAVLGLTKQQAAAAELALQTMRDNLSSR